MYLVILIGMSYILKTFIPESIIRLGGGGGGRGGAVEVEVGRGWRRGRGRGSGAVEVGRVELSTLSRRREYCH